MQAFAYYIAEHSITQYPPHEKKKNPIYAVIARTNFIVSLHAALAEDSPDEWGWGKQLATAHQI